MQDFQGCIRLDNAMVGDAEARVRRPLSTFAVLVRDTYKITALVQKLDLSVGHATHTTFPNANSRQSYRG
jgi:hypothetical protein